MSAFDPRLTPARPDLAADHLKDLVEAPRYAVAETFRVSVPVLDLTTTANPGASLATQLLWGEHFDVYDRRDGLAWGQSASDGYVGYVPQQGLATPAPATHRISVPLSHRYPKASMKTRPLGRLTLGARVVGEVSDGFLALADGGFCPEEHVAALDALETDFVAVAERFVDLPYLWGGRSALGIDCSGLVQISLDAAGQSFPRDSDMQEACGEALPEDATLRRGDLVFWAGHVGIMRDTERLLHATAHGMRVRTEPLAEVIRRIEAMGYGGVTSRRRLPA